MGSRSFILLAFIALTFHPTCSQAETTSLSRAEEPLIAPKWASVRPTLYGKQFVAQWVPIVHASGYRVYVDGRAVATQDGVIFAGPAPEESGTHIILIAALDETGKEGPFSLPGIIRVKSISAPLDVRTSPDRLKGCIKTLWNPADGAVLYNIYRALSPDEDFLFLETIQGKNSHEDCSVVEGNDYWYAVTATDINGRESGKSEKAMDRVGYIIRKPEWVDGYPRLTKHSTALLEWMPVPGAVAYRIKSNWDHLENTGRRHAFEPQETGGTQLEVSIPDPFGDYPAFFTVSAVFPYDVGPESVRGTLRYAPLHVEVFSDTAASSVVVSWAPSPQDASLFRVVRRHGGNSGEGYEVLDESIGVVSFVDNTSEIGENFLYRIFAIDSVGTVSRISSVVSGIRHISLPDYTPVVRINRQIESLLSDREKWFATLPERIRMIERHAYDLDASARKAAGLCDKIQRKNREKSNILNSKRDSDKKRYQQLSTEIESLWKELGPSVEDFEEKYGSAMSDMQPLGIDDVLQGQGLGNLWLGYRYGILASDRQRAVAQILEKQTDELLKKIDEQAFQVGLRERRLSEEYGKVARIADALSREMTPSKHRNLRLVLERISRLINDVSNYGSYFYYVDKENIDPKNILNEVSDLEEAMDVPLGVVPKYFKWDVFKKKYSVYGDRSLEVFTRVLVVAMNDWYGDWFKSVETLYETGQLILDSRRSVEEVWSQVVEITSPGSPESWKLYEP